MRILLLPLVNALLIYYTVFIIIGYSDIGTLLIVPEAALGGSILSPLLLFFICVIFTAVASITGKPPSLSLANASVILSGFSRMTSTFPFSFPRSLF